jgi:excisionase family DNA binding protein
MHPRVSRWRLIESERGNRPIRGTGRPNERQRRRAACNVSTLAKKKIMTRNSSTADVFSQVITDAVKVAVREVLNISPATNRRLLSAQDAATYLSLSKREVYNMIANRQLAAVTHGRRKMLDIRDLDEWIQRNKV